MTEQTLLRYTPSLARVIDKWRHSQLDTPSRADAMRRLIALALASAGYKLEQGEEEAKQARKKGGKT